MEILFGLLVLALLALGLYARKKERKTWVQEERYEESGDWMDKRRGERGTYGSLDEEMEANRRYIARAGKVSELARAMQAICFAQNRDFQNLSPIQIKEHLSFVKSEINAFFLCIDDLLAGKALAGSGEKPSHEDHGVALKKQLLDYSFEHFPTLLELEITQIQSLDRAAAQTAMRVVGKIKELQA